MISIKKCLEVMHSGAVFSLRVVSYDKRRKDKTGKVREYAEAVLLWGDEKEVGSKKRSEREMTALEKSLMAAPPIAETERNPNHAIHYTRNIRILMDGQPTEAVVKIHPALIIEFNGEPTTQ